MAIPGAVDERWRLNVVDVWEGLLGVTQLLKKQKNDSQISMIPNSSKKWYFFSEEKISLGGIWPGKHSFFSAFASPNLSV